MGGRPSRKVTDEEIIEASAKSTFMSEAAALVGLHRKTFTTRAKKLGVYKPANRQQISKKGHEASNRKHKYTLEDIFAGKHPQYSSNHLSRRLVAEGIFENKCSCCGITEWNNSHISLELDHINGNRNDHAYENLRLLCPNCHSQTPTYKNKTRT